MKILHVTNAVGWSGGLEQMVLLISELQKREHQNVLVCPPNSEAIARVSSIPLSSPLQRGKERELDSRSPNLSPTKPFGDLSVGERLRGNDTKVETLAMRQEYDLFAARKLNRIIVKHKPDIVHAHHPLAHSLALLAVFFNESPPLVVSRRVSFPLRKNPFSKWKYQSSRIRKIVAVSQAVKEILMQGGVNSSCIEVIYSAVRLEKFFPRPPNMELKKSLQLPEDFPVIGKIAHASPWKGQHIFLQAAKLCLQKNPKLCFILAGRDTEKLTSEVERLGISEQVRLLGMRSDVPEILSILDLSVNSAIFGEGLSGALRESLAMEIPVIASKLAGNAELVQDGVTGFLVTANRPDLLSEKILYALENVALAKELARNGKKWVEENCSLTAMAEKHLELYKTISFNKL